MENAPIALAVGTRQERFAKSDTDNGHDEQWQRELEKAYFEKQVAAMRSTGPADAGSQADKDFGSERVEQRSTPQREMVFVEGDENSFQIDQGAKRIASRSSVSSRGIQNHLPPTLSFRRTLAISGWGVVSRSERNPVGQNTVSPSRAVTIKLQGHLPSLNSVKAFVNEQGVHVVIRDPMLDDAGVLRLLGKIRGILAEDGLRLVSVTLNGETVWEDRGRDDAPETVADTEQRFDQSY